MPKAITQIFLLSHTRSNRGFAKIDIVLIRDFLRNFITVIIAACLLGIPAKSLASRLVAEIGLEARYVQGDSTYYISGVDPVLGSWASELEFPLDNFMAGVNVTIASMHEKNTRQTRSRLSVLWLSIVDDHAGIMKDSDWIQNDAAYGEPFQVGRDLYTESDAQIRGTIFDIDYAYHFKFRNRWTLGPMIGYRSQNFKYEVYDYRGTYWTTPVSGKGKVLDYEVTYKIPYVGLSSGLVFGDTDQFQLHLILAYSNWAEAKDRDDHVLRYKLSQGDCEGEAHLVEMSLDWNFYSHWVFGLAAEYSDIDTSGVQHQIFYEGPSFGTTYDVDGRISSSFWSAIAKVSYAF